MSHKKRWRIPFDWLNTYVLLIASKRQFDAFVAENEELTNEAPDWNKTPGFVATTTNDDGSEFFLICLTERMVSHDDIVHEATHVTHELLDSRGIPTDSYNTELIAYTISYLTREIVKRLGAGNVYHDDGGGL